MNVSAKLTPWEKLICKGWRELIQRYIKEENTSSCKDTIQVPKQLPGLRSPTLCILETPWNAISEITHWRWVAYPSVPFGPVGTRCASAFEVSLGEKIERRRSRGYPWLSNGDLTRDLGCRPSWLRAELAAGLGWLYLWPWPRGPSEYYH